MDDQTMVPTDYVQCCQKATVNEVWHSIHDVNVVHDNTQMTTQ